MVRVQELARASLLGRQRLEQLRGKAVFLSVRQPLTAALAFIELDGLARRVVLAPPDLDAEHVPALVQATEAEVWLGDSKAPAAAGRLPVRPQSSSSCGSRHLSLSPARCGDASRTRPSGHCSAPAPLECRSRSCTRWPHWRRHWRVSRAVRSG